MQRLARLRLATAALAAGLALSGCAGFRSFARDLRNAEQLGRTVAAPQDGVWVQGGEARDVRPPAAPWRLLVFYDPG